MSASRHSCLAFTILLLVALGSVISLRREPLHALDQTHDKAPDRPQSGTASNPAVNDPDRFAWELFSAISAPAKNGTNDTLWETWADQILVFADPNKAPVWPMKSSPKLLTPILQQRLRRANIQTGLPGGPLFHSSGVVPTIAKGGGQEVRVNKSAFDYIVKNRLWYLEGQEEVFSKGTSISFPVDAKEIKAMWKPIDESQKGSFHWNKDSSGKLFGLIALHISSKDLPNWFWATWEHKDNPDRCKILGCHDSFGLTTDGQVSAPLKALFKSSNMGSEWENYRLDGAQIDFTDSTGRPTLLGNSITEAGFVQTSSCLTCHARSTLNANGESLDVFTPDGQSYNGTPDPTWFFASSSGSTTRKYLQRDFVFSLSLAKPRRSLASSQKPINEIEINILGAGPSAKFVEDGKTNQEPVLVGIGQTVRWTNNGTLTHTATSDLKVDGSRLFDTGNIAPGESKSIVISKDLFAKAGGKLGTPLTLSYHCTPHPKTMQSSVIVWSTR